MFELNGKYYQVQETVLAGALLKGVVIFHEWLLIGQVGQMPFINSSYMLPFTYTEWGEDALEGINDLVIALETDWLPLNKDTLPSYLAEPLSLADRRLMVSNKIKAYRNSRNSNGGYPAAGKWFHSDQPSRIQQLSLFSLGASIPPGLNWKTLDGSFIAMTQSVAAAVFAAALNQDVATFAAAEVHLAAVAVSSDPESYDYSTGWPAIFGE